MRSFKLHILFWNELQLQLSLISPQDPFSSLFLIIYPNDMDIIQIKIMKKVINIDSIILSKFKIIISCI